MATNIKTKQLIYPYFVCSGFNKREKISHFPGVFRFSIDTLLGDIAKLKRAGINKILLFGIPEKKDDQGSHAFKENSIVARAVCAIKKEFSGVVVMTDVCMCAYTTHGHCGILKSPSHHVTRSQDFIDIKKTLHVLAKIALCHAQAGADWVAPSACAKHQVLAIRKTLTANGFIKTKVLGYSAKFASNFYGPFREAASSAPKFGDRQSYQLNFSDAKQALAEIKYDIDEGADMVMVKPALSYLDILREAHQKFNKPLAAYNVSGEYSMVKYGAKIGLWDEKKMVGEIITSITRAGADFVISYHAKDIAQWLKQ